MVLPGKKYTPEEMVGNLWRRKWLVIVPFLAIYAGTFAAAILLPDRYRSETLMMVVPQRVPEEYVKPTVTAKIEDRLRSIQQQILSRTNLERIIRDLNLYPSERQRLPMEDVVEKMRSFVQVDIVRGDAFRVAFVSESPKSAMDVAGRLATLFVDESLQDREVLANSTTDFLQTQLDEARRRLVEAEGKKAEFERRNAGSLPSDSVSNMALLHNLELQLQALVDSTNRDRDRRLFLERALAQMESEAMDARAAVPVSQSADAPGVVTGGTAAEQLEAARSYLKTLELRLKPEHPDVVYVKHVIQDLEAKVQAEATARPGDPAAQPALRRPTPEEVNTQRRIREARQEIGAVDIQLASKQKDEKRLRDQIAGIQARVATTPSLSAEFTALTRDYETLQKNYASLLAKSEDAKAAAALERRQIGEQFKVLDRARLPESPVSPNRPLIVIMGAIAGLGVGLAFVALAEQRDRGLRSEDDVLQVLRLPVLAVIPAIDSHVDRKRRRRRLALSVASATIVFIALAGITAYAVVSGHLRYPVRFR